MASVRGIVGYNNSSETNNLLAAYGTDIVDVATGLGYSRNLDLTTDVEFELFLNRIFFQNYSDRPMTFDGDIWSTKYVPRTPLAKYIREYKSRLYLGYCKFCSPQAPIDGSESGLSFPSRVFYSDLYVGNTLTWGLEWGQNGRTLAGTNLFYLNNSDAVLVQDFIAAGIKIGDSLFIVGGNAQLSSTYYTVASVENYRLRINGTFPVTATGLHYWVGGNWFDVSSDNNDVLMGLSDNTDRLLAYKLNSLWMYNGTQLRQAKDAPGTSYGRSVINWKGYTYYFHGSDPYLSGIYRFDGVNAVKISRAIDPYILGMSTTNYTAVVAWREGEELKWYLGDITNTNRGLSITKAVASYNTVTNSWDVYPVQDAITCSTIYKTSNRVDTYCGTSDDQVMQMSDGYNQNGTPVKMNLETKVYYPSGSETINEFIRVQVIGRQTKGIKVMVRLWDMPTEVGEWMPLGELTEDKTELLLPNTYKFASGIQLKFLESSSYENDLYVEKITIFYKPSRSRLL